MELTNALLQNISKEIRTGRPLAAIAKANLYLEKDCPLRLALVQKAASHIRLKTKNVKRILSGETVNYKILRKALDESGETENTFRQQHIPKNFELQINRALSKRRYNNNFLNSKSLGE